MKCLLCEASGRTSDEVKTVDTAAARAEADATLVERLREAQQEIHRLNEENEHLRHRVAALEKR